MEREAYNRNINSSYISNVTAGPVTTNQNENSMFTFIEHVLVT